MKKFNLLVIFLLFSCSSIKKVSHEEIISSSLKTDTSQVESKEVITYKTQGDTIELSQEELYVSPKLEMVTIFKTGRGKGNNFPSETYGKLYEKEKISLNKVIVDTTISYVDSKYSVGNIAYNVPDTMKLGVYYRVVLRINNGQKSISIKGISDNVVISSSDLKVSSVTNVEKIPVGEKMTASLIDVTKSFDINFLGISETQKIYDNYSEWSWVVKPNKLGNNELRLVVTLNGDKDFVVFDKKIYADRNLGLVLYTFVSKNWQWLISTLIIPIFLFWYKKRKKK